MFLLLQIPKTIENQRKLDASFIPKDTADLEIVKDELDDEFRLYYSDKKHPKIMITTRPKCSRKLYPFIADLMQMIPNSFYYPRGFIDPL